MLHGNAKVSPNLAKVLDRDEIENNEDTWICQGGTRLRIIIVNMDVS